MLAISVRALCSFIVFELLRSLFHPYGYTAWKELCSMLLCKSVSSDAEIIERRTKTYIKGRGEKSIGYWWSALIRSNMIAIKHFLSESNKSRKSCSTKWFCAKKSKLLNFFFSFNQNKLIKYFWFSVCACWGARVDAQAVNFNQVAGLAANYVSVGIKRPCHQAVLFLRCVLGVSHKAILGEHKHKTLFAVLLLNLLHGGVNKIYNLISRRAAAHTYIYAEIMNLIKVVGAPQINIH